MNREMNQPRRLLTDLFNLATARAHPAQCLPAHLPPAPAGRLIVLAGGKAAKGDGTSPVFFGVVLGFLGVKLVLFLVFVLWLRTQDWMDTRVFAFTAIAAVIGSLVTDLLAFARARVPYVSDVSLPGEESPKP